jgi:hypothetical protein
MDISRVDLDCIGGNGFPDALKPRFGLVLDGHLLDISSSLIDLYSIGDNESGCHLTKVGKLNGSVDGLYLDTRSNMML